MPTQHQTKPQVEYPTGPTSPESRALIYAELDEAIVAAIVHARTFCLDEIATDLQSIFHEMQTKRVSVEPLDR